MAMMTETRGKMPSAHMFPRVYIDLGIDVSGLGCIMIDLEPLEVSDIIALEDLYYSEDMEFAQGIVSEDKCHCTLLYGLMSSGPAMKKHVDAVLDGWSIAEVEIAGVSYFESTSGDNPYYCLIAELVVTPALIEGNGRLKFLPSIDTFIGYKPHITLAYIKSGDEQKRDNYIEKLNARFVGISPRVTGLNYGS